MLNYRTKTLKRETKEAEDMVICRAKNLGTDKCDTCDNKFICLTSNLSITPTAPAVAPLIKKKGYLYITVTPEGFETDDWSKLEKWEEDDEDAHESYIDNVGSIELDIEINKSTGQINVLKVNGRRVV